VRIDSDYLRSLSGEFSKVLASTESEIYQLAGEMLTSTHRNSFKISSSRSSA
jgi:DNA polymerase I-like protein with 3'-5' exonuclease and polymerase domains